MENSSSFAEFGRLIPTSDQEMGCRVKNTFDEANEEAYDYDSVGSFGSGKGKG